MPAVSEIEVVRTEALGAVQLVRMPDGAAGSWSQVLPLELGRDYTCLLTYDPARRQATVLLYNGPEAAPEPVVQPLEGVWTHLITGHFYTTDPADLLLYNKATGEMALHTIEAGGRLTAIDRVTIKAGYTALVPGNYLGPDYQTDFFCYDAQYGVGDFYSIEADGKPELHGTHRAPRGCSKVIPGRFTADGGLRTDLLFYNTFDDRGRTRIDLFQTDQARLTSRATITAGVSYAHTILPGCFDSKSPPERSDLLFYNHHSGRGEFWRISDFGAMERLSSHYWESGWTIVPGTFVESPHTSLLFMRTER